MIRLASCMTEHHRECDEIFTRLDQSVELHDWDAADPLMRQACEIFETHFSVEEGLVFPRFERATCTNAELTQVMRDEHARMRQLLSALEAAVAARDAETFIGESDTLFVLLQQHNMKEENVFYPMCDAHLHAEMDELVLRVQHTLNGVPDESR